MQRRHVQHGLAAMSVLGCLLAVLQPLQAHAAYSLGGDPGGDLAVNVAPGYANTWATLNSNLTSGFCFSEAEGRVLLNYSQPLYSQVITIDGDLVTTAVHLMWAWVIKILLQERVSREASGDTRGTADGLSRRNRVPVVPAP